MSLEKEIEQNVNEIKTDAYSMSIGEVSNLYKEGDLDIFPEYQRYFRWDIKQKSDLIESILLGIPVPPIFVAQESNGKWDVIDGLQRISTILEFMGILKKRDGKNLYEPSKLIKTKFLPSLEGKYWENKSDVENSLSSDLRRKFKRSKLDFIIIDSTVNPKAKYEMFQRLNTNSSQLTEQEVRNCLMLMVNSKYYKVVQDLANDETYKEIVTNILSEKLLREQYDKELIVRYMIARYSNLDNINSQQDIGIYLTEEFLSLMEKEIVDLEKISEEFKSVMVLLKEVLGQNAFVKYDSAKDCFTGGFSLSMYEAILVGLSENQSIWEEKEKVVTIIKSIPDSGDFENATRRGKRAITRFHELTKLSRIKFQNED